MSSIPVKLLSTHQVTRYGGIFHSVGLRQTFSIEEEVLLQHVEKETPYVVPSIFEDYKVVLFFFKAVDNPYEVPMYTVVQIEGDTSWVEAFNA